MEKQRRLWYATNLAHKPTEKKHKDDNMQTPAHTHRHTLCECGSPYYLQQTNPVNPAW